MADVEEIKKKVDEVDELEGVRDDLDNKIDYIKDEIIDDAEEVIDEKEDEDKEEKAEKKAEEKQKEIEKKAEKKAEEMTENARKIMEVEGFAKGLENRINTAEHEIDVLRTEFLERADTTIIDDNTFIDDDEEIDDEEELAEEREEMKNKKQLAIVSVVSSVIFVFVMFLSFTFKGRKKVVEEERKNDIETPPNVNNVTTFVPRY